MSDEAAKITYDPQTGAISYTTHTTNEHGWLIKHHCPNIRKGDWADPQPIFRHIPDHDYPALHQQDMETAMRQARDELGLLKTTSPEDDDR